MTYNIKTLVFIVNPRYSGRKIEKTFAIICMSDIFRTFLPTLNLLAFKEIQNRLISLDSTVNQKQSVKTLTLSILSRPALSQLLLQAVLPLNTLKKHSLSVTHLIIHAECVELNHSLYRR